MIKNGMSWTCVVVEKWLKAGGQRDDLRVAAILSDFVGQQLLQRESRLS